MGARSRIARLADETIQTIHADFERIQSEHVGLISQMIDAEDNWGVVALINQDGSLADMVEIPDAFSLSSEQASQAIARTKALYGGADAYVFLASAGQITENPEFFENTGWGQYLSSQPNVRGHMLVGAGSHHVGSRIKSYPIAGELPGRLRQTQRSIASNAKANLTHNLARLIVSDTKGNLWEQAKEHYVQTLERDLLRTAPLSESEERELRNQINLAMASVLKARRIIPEVGDRTEAEETFRKLEEQSEKWRQKTTISIEEDGLSVSAEHAYLMHYLANAQENDVVVIPDAGEGMLAAFAPFSSHVLLTESDTNRRAQLQSLGFANINDASSASLAAYWAENEALAEVKPNVILLDSRNPETFWAQLNQALHAVEVGGRVVARINMNVVNKTDEEIESLKEIWQQNFQALGSYYQVRSYFAHNDSSIFVVDRVSEVTEQALVTQKYDNAEDLMVDAEKVRMTRTGTPMEPQLQRPIEEMIEVEQVPPTSASEAEEQQKHTKPRSLDVNKEETHREWIDRVQAALGNRYTLTSATDAKRLYDDMMAVAHSVPTHIDNQPRPEADVRAEIEKVWDTLIGFTPGTGWEKFVARITAASLSMNYDPNMVYQLKLYELLDDHEARDLSTVLDARTDQVDTLVSTSYRLSHNKPIKLMGETIADAEDAAILFQPFRNPNHEQLLLMGVDGDGNVIKPVGVTAQNGSGIENLTNFEIQRILANNPDIKGFWIAHNHAEASSTFSDADITSESRIKNRFRDIFKGFIATNTGEFSSIVDGELQSNQEFEKPIDDVYLQRPGTHGVLGMSAGYHPQFDDEVNQAEPAYIAGLVRETQQDLAHHQDLVTFVFVSPEMDEPGTTNRSQVVAVESHKNLHTLSAEELHTLIRDMNTAHGAFQTFVVVDNPSDKALYSEGSAWSSVLSEASDLPLISGIHISTKDKSFPFRNQTYDLNKRVQHGIIAASGKKLGLVGLDMSTGRPINAHKQRKFTEFMLFEYLAHGNMIDWAAARTYADRYFDEPLTESQLRQIGDIAFNEYLDVIRAYATYDD